MLGQFLDNVREKSPLIHNITNYVTVNDCANILLAAGASPIMAEEESEVAEITSIAQGLNINIGMATKAKAAAMVTAGKRSNALGHITVLDRVGAGASEFRNGVISRLLKSVKFTVIKGNASEIKSLATGMSNFGGVDAETHREGGRGNMDFIIKLAENLGRKARCTVVVTGKTDIVTDGDTTYLVHNGHEMMSRITGSGCMLSALITAFAAANKENVTRSVLAGVCAMGLAGEKAARRIEKPAGSGTFKTYLIDEIFNMTGEELERGAKYEMR